MLIIAVAAPAVTGCKKKPAWKYPDRSTPRFAALTFATALEQGDAETARACCIAGGIEVDLVDALTKATPVLKRLGNAVGEKFGDEGRRALESGAAVANPITMLSSAEVQEFDDRALVTPTNGKPPITLVKTDDQWKVDVGVLVKGQDITYAIPLLRIVETAAKKITDDLNVGKYASGEEVRTALQKAMLEGLAAEGRVPSTTPSIFSPALTTTTAPSPDL